MVVATEERRMSTFLSVPLAFTQLSVEYPPSGAVVQVVPAAKPRPSKPGLAVARTKRLSGISLEGASR